MRLIFLILCLTLTTAVLDAKDTNIILKPTKVSSTQAGFVFFQGAYIPAQNYVKYARQLQQKFNGALWVALVSFPINLPDPILSNKMMSAVLSDLKRSGFAFNNQTLFFFGGHSLGGAVIELYLFDEENVKRLPVKFSGLVFEGAFVRRSNYAKALNPLMPPILTMGAELDGLARATRMAESFRVDDEKRTSGNLSYTIIIPGMNHYQFVGDGQPPSFVAKNDIEPEIDAATATDQLTSIVAAFLDLRMGVETAQDLQTLAVSLEWTREFTGPILEALRQEGFYHFAEPCYKSKSLRPPNCTLGAPWSVYAQVQMAGVAIEQLNITDTFHPVLHIPDLFPKINNNCSSTSKCVLNVSTTTDNEYALDDGLDRGIDPIAAIEAKTKLKSRQAILEALTNKKYDFNQTDGASHCAEINQQSINEAIKLAAKTSLKRYFTKGRLLRVVDDKQVKSGPQWILSKLVSHFFKYKC